MASVTKERLCQVLALAEQLIDFYKDSLKACDNGLVRDIFERIVKEKERHLAYLTKLVESMSDETDLVQACALLEEEPSSALPAFAELEKAFAQQGKCEPNAWLALGKAMDMELKAAKFYEEQLAQSPEEDREFFQRMVQEMRGQYVLLSDLQYYLNGEMSTK